MNSSLRAKRLDPDALASLKQARRIASINGRNIIGTDAWLRAFVDDKDYQSAVWTSAFANVHAVNEGIKRLYDADGVVAAIKHLPETSSLRWAVDLAMDLTDGPVTRLHILWWILGGESYENDEDVAVKMLDGLGVVIVNLKNKIKQGIDAGIGAEMPPSAYVGRV